jgi:hypothetical protein
LITRIIFLGTDCIFKYTSGHFNDRLYRAITQAVGRRSFTGEGRVQAQTIPYEIFGGHSCTRTGFSPRTSVFPHQYQSTNAPHVSSSTRSCLGT